MKVLTTSIPSVLIIEPKVFSDDRGFFFESFNQKKWQEVTGVSEYFVQDNYSRSAKNVLRGLHYQIKHPQGKLVRVTVGQVFDVAVDIRKSSPTFGNWVGVHLTAENKRQLWVPTGFAHGFLVLSDVAEVLYKTSDYWMPEYEQSIAWNDPDLAVEWPVVGVPILARKDAEGKAFRDAVFL